MTIDEESTPPLKAKPTLTSLLSLNFTALLKCLKKIFVDDFLPSIRFSSNL